jgi:hypothetical protein
MGEWPNMKEKWATWASYGGQLGPFLIGQLGTLIYLFFLKKNFNFKRTLFSY